MTNTKKILSSARLVTQLWGKDYIETFANYAIPTLISNGNLPTLNKFNEVIYEFHSTTEGLDILQTHPNFDMLRQMGKDFIEFEFTEVQEKIEDPYRTMSDCHRISINKADESDSVIFFIQPDVLVGDGSFATAIESLLQGKNLVMSPGIRTNKEGMVEQLSQRKDKAAITSRELVELATHNLHPISQSLFWDEGKINSYCSHIYWEIESKKSLYMHCAHMHPFMVYPEIKNCGFTHTIDWDYFGKACPNPETWFVANSSDQVCLIEMSESGKFVEGIKYVATSTKTLVNFMYSATISSHITLFEKPYIFQAEDIDANEVKNIYSRVYPIINEAIYVHESKLRSFINHPAFLVAILRKLLLNADYKMHRIRHNYPIFGGISYYLFKCVFNVLKSMARLHRMFRKNS